jgi:hypothetical protein
MDRFLRINIRDLAKELSLHLTDNSFDFVVKNVKLTFDNKIFMDSWRLAFDSVQKTDRNIRTSSRDDSIAICRPRSSAYAQSFGDYETYEKNGLAFYMNGMKNEEEFMPVAPRLWDASEYVSATPNRPFLNMGSYLAGVDTGTISGARAEHEKYKDKVFNKLERILESFKKDFEYNIVKQHKSDSKDIYSDMLFWETKVYIETFSKLVKVLNSRTISRLPIADVLAVKLDALDSFIHAVFSRLNYGDKTNCSVLTVAESVEWSEFTTSLDDYIIVCKNNTQFAITECV